jgi:hypothetical protein
MTDKERRIREVAHRIWEDEGRPADQAERHWEMAQRVVEAADPKGSTLVPGTDPEGVATPSGTDRTVPTGPEPAVPRGAKREPRAESKPAK